MVGLAITIDLPLSKHVATTSVFIHLYPAPIKYSTQHANNKLRVSRHRAPCHNFLALLRPPCLLGKLLDIASSPILFGALLSPN